MSLTRARIVKKAFPSEGTRTQEDTAPALARRLPRALLDAREEARRIVEAARREADTLTREARVAAEQAAREAATTAREEELARLAADILIVRSAEERRRERDLERTVGLAKVLAERLVGEVLAASPERLRHLAAEVLRETRGSRELRIEANAQDRDVLAGLLEPLGTPMAELVINDELGRGSLIVHTELGRIDARLEPQLTRLADALLEALRAERHPSS